MAFKLTYSDGQESQHGDDTVWDLDDGVLKLGKKEGEWSVLLSPSHWAVLEFVSTSSKDDDSDDDDDDDDDDKDRNSDDSGKDKSDDKADKKKDAEKKDDD